MGERRMHRLVLILSLLVAVAVVCTLSACGTFHGFGGGEQSENVNVNIYPDNYRAELIAFLQTYLNDPTNVRDAQLAAPELRDVGSASRYAVCLKYNAKNNDGRYLGVKEYAAVYLRGRFNQMVNATGEVCKGAAYTPFLELMSLPARPH
jgi:predicted small secreted protein